MKAIECSLNSNFQANNVSRSHTWISDEPIDLGGKDEGPTPKELLLSSLASCKVITVKMYADRKGWEVNDVKINLRIIEEGTPTIIEKKISFIGNLDSEQIKRLTDISGRCPVAKMLSNSIEFKLV